MGLCLLLLPMTGLHSSINITLSIYCRIGVDLFFVIYLFLIFMEKEVTFLERQNEIGKFIAVCMLSCGQDRREILVGSMDWQAVSVIVFHSVIKPGDNARVVKVE